MFIAIKYAHERVGFGGKGRRGGFSVYVQDGGGSKTPANTASTYQPIKNICTAKEESMYQLITNMCKTNSFRIATATLAAPPCPALPWSGLIVSTDACKKRAKIGHLELVFINGALAKKCHCGAFDEGQD